MLRSERDTRGGGTPPHFLKQEAFIAAKTAEEKRAYQKKYREENREELREKDRKRYNENKEKERARNKKYREENRDKINKRQRKYRQENPEKTKETASKSYHKNKKKHREERMIYAKKYYQKNKEIFKAYRMKQYEKNGDTSFFALLKKDAFCQFDGCKIENHYMLTIHHLFPDNDEIVIVLCSNHHLLIDHNKEGFLSGQGRKNKNIMEA